MSKYERGIKKLKTEIKTIIYITSSSIPTSTSSFSALPSSFLKKVSTSKASWAIGSLAELKASSFEKSKFVQSMGPDGSEEASSTRISKDPSIGAFLPRGRPECLKRWKQEIKLRRKGEGGKEEGSKEVE